MRVRISATRICRYDASKGEDDGKERCRETKDKTGKAVVHSGRTDRLYPAPGLAAPRRDLRPRDRHQSDADAMGGALQADGDWPLFAKSTGALDLDGCRHHQGRDRSP